MRTRSAMARLVGELRELLAMGLDESGYAVAVAELGMEVDPPAPYAPGAWLELVAHRLGMPPADYAASPHEDMG
ncbi:contact-dependent growth inhibition system immunity protein [Streptomyces sp. NPDC047725]|uniref:contact-dependent growth inhibition system immunity protein n=1 Tax=Streptomyces sp. NPDC047725 TaxID=3365487 RepID=UPI0037211AEB